jgi:hypothetical protein
MSTLSIVTQLSAAAQPWADLYSGSTTLQAGVMFAHLGGVLLSGGAAVTTDRATLSAWRLGLVARQRHLATLRTSHRMILLGLGVTISSGVLLLGADIETLIVSVPFWVKMGLLAALLVNGLLITRAERPTPGSNGGALDVSPAATRQWLQLRVLSYSSLVLWFALLLASTLLVTAA